MMMFLWKLKEDDSVENKNSDITILTDFNAIIDVDLAILKMIYMI